MLYPAASGALCDILINAASRSQVIITTHSPDLISRFPAESLRIVEREKGLTKIGSVTEDNCEAIDEKLFTSGDLLRIGALKRG
jgi:predicted ATPase